MAKIFSDYTAKAKQILDKNWLGTSTKPAPALYPHQWNWDSAFIAIGRSHYDVEKAIQEIETLFEAQWKNGMLPQIIFNEEALGNYFPEPDFWQAELSADYPENTLTSGITMPPVVATAVEMIHENANRPDLTIPFLKSIFPKLVKLHRYFYEQRDPNQEGLVYIRHPWESGMDNSPMWDGPLNAIKIDPSQLPEYERKDLSSEDDTDSRPQNEDYDRYVYLIDLYRQKNYDEKEIFKACPFLVQDPLFNSILCRANESLVKIAKIIGEPSHEYQQWVERTAKAIEKKLWCEESSMFGAFDLANDNLIKVDSAAGFLPLFSGAANDEQAKTLYRRLDSASFCSLHQGNCFTIPNHDRESRDYNRSKYWRGPVWMNINWMLAHGLMRYGYTLKADSLRKDLIQLPIRYGFHEYFDSTSGKGYGTDNFGWTSALFIDMVEKFYSAQDKTQNKLFTLSKILFTKRKILNEGYEEQIGNVKDISIEVMALIKELKDRFYNVSMGRVDYSAIKDSEEFNRYQRLVSTLSQFDLSTIGDRNRQLAFWINIYNSLVIHGIIFFNIENTVKETPGFFSVSSYNIGGHILSLDDIEHGILRANARAKFGIFKQFSSFNRKRSLVVNPFNPLVHFALVCGSRSCAPIDFYDADDLKSQLEEAAKDFINSSEVIVFSDQKILLLSEIFRWYEKDFGGKKGIFELISKYSVDEQVCKLLDNDVSTVKIEYNFYDWNLNH